MRTVIVALLWVVSTVSAFAETPIKDALRLLESDSVSERITALGKLAHLPPHISASEPLLHALNDPSSQVRVEALKTWERIGDPYDLFLRLRIGRLGEETREEIAATQESFRKWQLGLVQAIRVQTDQEDDAVRQEATRCLAALGDDVKGIFPPLGGFCGTGMFERLEYLVGEELAGIAKARPEWVFDLLQDREANVVYNAAGALRQVDYAPLYPRLEQFLRDPRPEWRAIAIDLLSNREGAVRRILPLLADRDDRVREAALYALQNPDEATRQDDSLLAGLANDYATARPPLRRSILALIKTKEQVLQYRALIMAAWQDPNGDVRADALDLAWRMDVDLPVPLLISCLHHPSAHLRRTAVQLLGTLELERTTSLFIPILYDRNEGVVEEAMRVLCTAVERGVGGSSLLKTLVSAFRRSKQTENYPLQSALTRWNPEVQPLVLSLLSDPDWRLRALAARAAMRSLQEAAVDPLLRLTQDKHPKVRWQAIYSLIEFKLVQNDQVLKALIDLLKDTDYEVRTSAIYGLENLKDVRAVEGLQPLLRDEDEQIAGRAKRAIRMLTKSTEK